jgi:ATP-dependent RNA helicase RhlB
VEVECDSVATDTVEQVVYVVTASEKFTVLYNLLQKYPDQRILVFCNRKVTTEGIVRKLRRYNIACDMLSGDVNQNRRLRVLEEFRSGKTRIVIATDVAGRGIHVDDVGFVVNYDFPYEAGDYVHRIGRTGRAGQQGTAISFADEDESFIIPEIEKFIDEPLKCTMLMGDDPLMADIPKPGRHPRVTPKTAISEKETTSPEKTAATVQENTPADSVSEKEPEQEPAKEPAKEPEKVEKVEEAPAAPVPVAEKRREKPAPKRRPPRSDGSTRRGGRSSSGSSERRERSPVKKTEPAAANKTAPSAKTQKRSRFSDEWVPGQ